LAPARCSLFQLLRHVVALLGAAGTVLVRRRKRGS